MRVAIIGGGIAGLAAAYELDLARKAGGSIEGVSIEYDVFEAGSRLGGVLSSAVVNGTVIEHGPDSFLTEKPATADLCRELGLASELIPSDDAQRKTFVLVRNRLVPLPDGLMFLTPTKLIPTALSPLFSIWTKLRMGLELLQSPQKPGPDESVASLVRRHYGQQVVDRLADPLLSGIFGGSSEQLSAQSVLPRLVAMEAKYGSLTRGTLAAIRARRAVADAALAKLDDDEDDNEYDREPPPAPAIFTTLRGGMQQLVNALVERLDSKAFRLNCPINSLNRTSAGWRVTDVNGTSQDYDGVIVATPAWASAEMLRRVDPPLCAELEAIPYSSSATISLVYDGFDLDPLPEGFGFLVPAIEGRSMLACTFLHRKFPDRTAPGKSVLRAFVGGVHHAGLLSQSDESLIDLVRKELFEILQLSAVPELADVHRWPRAMAQYAVGHKDRLAKIQSRLAALSGLDLAGNAYDGIGISDCIRLGRNAARKMIAVAKPLRQEVTAAPSQPGSGQVFNSPALGSR